MPATQIDEASRQAGKAEIRTSCRFPQVVRPMPHPVALTWTARYFNDAPGRSILEPSIR